ncbi:hypothetical protein GCM10027570_28150 [Streptomonospora sediminis]
MSPAAHTAKAVHSKAARPLARAARTAAGEGAMDSSTGCTATTLLNGRTRIVARQEGFGSGGCHESGGSGGPGRHAGGGAIGHGRAMRGRSAAL